MRLIPVLAVCLSLGAGYQTKKPQVKPHPWSGRVIHLEFGIACPVTPWLALTPVHVVEGHTPGWMDAFGKVWPLELLVRDDKHDFALVRSEHPFPGYSERAVGAPQAGETVWLVARISMLAGHDGITVLPATVIGVDTDGDLLLDGLSFPGASGGCVLNRDGKLIGMHKSSRHYSLSERSQLRSISVNVPVWK